MKEDMKKQRARPVSLFFSLLVVAFLVGILAISVNLYDSEAHIPIAITAVFAAIIAFAHGFKWKDLEAAILRTLAETLPSMLIFLIIGIVIGLWILGGIVPSMIYYGLQIISPKIFLPTACIIASIVSLATGSSWTTVGTIGIALMGVGQGLKIPLGPVAGAIISGAYFGDKLSPLSDTTNMAPAVAGTDIFTHIKHMLYTSVPSYLISLVLFFIIGLNYSSGSFNSEIIRGITTSLDSVFTISPILGMAPLMIIVLVLLKVPTIPILVLSCLMGAFLAVVFQGANLGEIINSAHYGFISSTGIADIDQLLTGGGLNSMLSPLSLVFASISLAGIMEASGMVEAIANKILSLAKGVGGLIAATVATCIGVNLMTGDQYLSIIFTGKMYRHKYDDLGLDPKNLSRTLEDAGTLSSPLIPWGACGVFMASTLGVATLTYLPFTFVSLINPIIALIYGYTGFSIAKKQPEENEDNLDLKNIL